MYVKISASVIIVSLAVLAVAAALNKLLMRAFRTVEWTKPLEDKWFEIPDVTTEIEKKLPDILQRYGTIDLKNLDDAILPLNEKNAPVCNDVQVGGV